MGWANALEEEYDKILGPIEKMNDAILSAGDLTYVKVLDLSGAPDVHNTTATTHE
jgi:hypothetical protein